MRNKTKSIDAAALEQSLEVVRSHAAGSEAGVFGPNSQIWRIDREVLPFLGAWARAPDVIGSSLGRHRNRTALNRSGRSHRTVPPHLPNCVHAGVRVARS